MVTYEVVEVHALPVFDPARTVKHVLFSPRNVVRVSRWMRRHLGVITWSYFLGVALFPFVLVVNPALGQMLGLLEVALELPACVSAFLTLRVDLVLLLLSSYDYWFVSSITIAFAVSFSVLTRDLRAVFMMARWLSFQIPILIDANINQGRSLIWGLLMNVVLMVFLMGAISLHAIQGFAHAEAGAATDRALSTRDLLLNGVGTIIILLLRIVIRKHELTRGVAASSAVVAAAAAAPPGRHPTITTVVKCVTIRSSIMLREVVQSSIIIPPSPARSSSSRRPAESLPSKKHLESLPSGRNLVSLRRLGTFERFSSDAVVFPGLLPLAQSAPFVSALRVLGVTGISLTIACGGLPLLSSNRAVEITVCAAALACSSTFVAASVAFSNRRLLRLLLTSFDFAFLSLQVSAAHMCVGDMLLWRLAPTIALLSAWLWIHWVLTQDALTPDMKTRLGLHRRCWTAAATSIYFAGQVVFCTAGLLGTAWEVRNRRIVSVTWKTFHIESRVAPFFVSRLFTVSVWTLRLAWRLCRRADPNQLLLLRGQVEFEYALPSRVPPPAPAHDGLQ